MRGVRIAITATVAALVIAACGGSSHSNATKSASKAPPASSAPQSAPPAGSAAPAAPPAPCPPGGPQPSGATHDVGSADVDGDGRNDTFTVDDRGEDQSQPETLRLTTASGVRSALVIQPQNAVGTLGVVQLTSGPAVLVEQLNNTANPSLVQMIVFHNCQLVSVHNQEGQPYQFEVWAGSGDGTSDGVGCLPAAGGNGGNGNQIVGLKGEPAGDNQIKWTRTVVDVTADQARNGAVQSGMYTKGKDDKGIALLSTVSCGDRQYDQLA